MPSFPQPGEVTVCEINRDFIYANTFSEYEDRAKETYAEILGMVFNAIQFDSDFLSLNQAQIAKQETAESTNDFDYSFSSLKSVISNSFNKFFFPSSNLNLIGKIGTQKVSWYQHKHCLAFISGPNQVTIRDFEDSDGKDLCVLMSDIQRDVKAIEWRPNSGKMIAVSCKGGICIWSASYQSNPAILRNKNSPFLGTISRGSGLKYILVDFIKCDNSNELVTTLSWRPDGRYLASASCESPSFTIWDVAQGEGNPIRRGLGSSISLLKWSPTGDYLFTANFDGTFYLWETNTWTSEPWSSTSGHVTGAEWDPEGRIILISFSESTTLGSIHFASRPPSLDAQLLPVELPDISTLIGSQGIEKIAWDASGERLALSYKNGDEKYKGLIAIYDVRRTPLVSTTLIGFIRGPGENVRPLEFAFHNKFKQGPLLSVCWSTGWCCTYPLISHSNLVLQI
ncbi:hypothetical protein LUZ60_002035 [Juncus effusus]|nr:hypothetical protein LUZ60_002035 [Juncus effusus]